MPITKPGDCEGACSAACQTHWIADGYCDPACNSQNCMWDGGDCANVETCSDSPFCPLSWKGDCVCDESCNNAACDLDGGDCAETQSTQCTQCSPGCYGFWIRDDNCDTLCNNRACDFDGGDCSGVISDVCAWTNDGVCDEPEVCKFCTDTKDCGPCPENGVEASITIGAPLPADVHQFRLSVRAALGRLSALSVFL